MTSALETAATSEAEVTSQLKKWVDADERMAGWRGRGVDSRLPSKRQAGTATLRPAGGMAADLAPRRNSRHARLSPAHPPPPPAGMRGSNPSRVPSCGLGNMPYGSDRSRPVRVSADVWRLIVAVVESTLNFICSLFAEIEGAGQC